MLSLINNSHLQGGSRTANYSWNYVCVSYVYIKFATLQSDCV